MTFADTDSAPLGPRQLWVLLAAAIRQLLWGLRAVSVEVESWRTRALCAADAAIREDAVESLQGKRTHLDGAALFWIVPGRRNQRLLRLLVSYEIALEVLDNANERAAQVGPVNGRQLHLALGEALTPDGPVSEYYRYHPGKDDGGYLRTLVRSARGDCASLPAYALVRERAVREAARAQVLALNHDPDPVRRVRTLREWAGREYPEGCGCGVAGESCGDGGCGYLAGNRTSWFELSGAATASLTVHVLLALGAEGRSTESTVARAHAVYFPGLSLATTMLDSYVDREEDAASGGHSYISYYGAQAQAVARLREVLRESIHGARRLPGGHRHAVLAACMVAMYLSRDSARHEHSREETRQLMLAGGSLTRLLLPVLRIWRIAYALRSA